MREQPVLLMAWLQRDLTARFNGVVRETLPQEMLDLLAGHEERD